MADVLPLPVTRTGESAQELLLEQRDVLVRVENVLERSYSRLDIIQDVVTQSLGIQKQQLAMFQRQLENQEFANEEARREAARMRADSRIVSSSAAVQTESSGGVGSIGTAASAALGGVAGGLAAGGLASALRGLAGRLLRGGGLVGIGTIFGEQIGNFLGTEAAAILEDLGVDPQFANEVGSAIRNNTQSALVGAGISKLLLGRTLPGIIGGIIWNQLDLNRILTPEGRNDLEESIRGWFERLRDGELTDEDIRNGAIVGATAAYGARQLQRGGQALGRRFPTFRPDGTVEGPGQSARPGGRPAPRPVAPRRFPSFRPDGTVEGPGQAARPGGRTALTPGVFTRPRRPNGQFMSDAEIQDMYEQQIRDARSKRAYRNVIRGLAFLGVVLTAYEAYQLYQILNSPASEETKIAAVGGFVGSFVGALGGGVAGASLGGFFGPWGALIGGALGAGGGAFAGGYIGDYIARWAFNHEPPVYQTQEQYEQFIEQNRERFLAGPNAMIIPGVTADPSGAIQRSAPSYGAQFGSTPSARPNPEAQRLNREGIDLLEDVVSELEKLNKSIESSGSVSAAGFTTTQDGARIYNAALGTSMSAGGRPIQAAFTPSFGDSNIIRASLDPSGSTGSNSANGKPAWMNDEQWRDLNAAARRNPDLVNVSDTVAAIEELAARYNLNPSAISSVIDVESNMGNVRNLNSGSYRGAFQWGGATRSELGDISNLSFADQIRAQGSYYQRWNLQERLPDLGSKSAAEQAAVLQALQFAPSGNNWLSAYQSGNMSPRSTGSRQASVLGDTSIGQMQRYFEGQTSSAAGARVASSAGRFPIPLTGGAAARGAESSLVFQPAFAQALMAMYAAAPDYVKSGLRILSGYRSPEIQRQLYEQKLSEVRAAHPNWSDSQIETETRRWVAPPGSSRHNTGQAADLSYANDRVKQWVHQNAGRFGLGFPLANEDWHIELIGLDGRRVAMIDAPPVSYAGDIPSGAIAGARPAPQGGRVAPAPRRPSTGGDLEAAQSMMGSFAQAIQSLTGSSFGFDELFGEGTYANILTSSNPEQFLANKLSNVFNRTSIGVTPSAVALNRGSERATTAPIVINAPVVNNDNSINGGGGSNGRTMASQERAIPVMTDRSLASTVSEWWDATMA